ncbi:MAG: nonribosomal peptide synthetase MxaA [Methylococcaceae bacterium]|nr:nonribosomal peptide synthetase MxaA [Methylococcaceae bacterium]
MMRANRPCVLLLAALLTVLATMPARAESLSPLSPELQAPRPFGFVIGDLIQHRITVELDSAFPLKPDSVPPVGPINYWLELRDAEIEQKENQGKTGYTIDLIYQTFYAPREVETLAIPGFTLLFEGPGKTMEAAVQSWHFTMSVIRELSVLSRDGRSYMRPDDPPMLFDMKGPVSRLLILAGALILSIGLFSYSFGYLSFSRRGRIFHEALRNLEGLVKCGDERERLKAVLSIVHTAFNQAYGRPLFYDGLDDFFANHPGYRRVEQNIAEFFRASNALFFFGTEPTPVLYSSDQAMALCRICRAIERGIH